MNLELTIEELCWLWHHADDWMHGHDLCVKLRDVINAKSRRDLSDEEIREIARLWRLNNQ